jgi:histidinol-phosphate/aromatic aminotransferase/cobyric acid decarboxylase-like protein
MPTWNINTIAEYFVTELSKYTEEYALARQNIMVDMRFLYEQLCTISALFVYPSAANFYMIRIENGMTARELQRILLERYCLYVRDCTNKIGLDAYHIRVASQGGEKDTALITALREIFGTKE